MVLALMAILVMTIIIQSDISHTNFFATTDTNLELSLLSSLPTNQTAAANGDLLNATYWRMVISFADSAFGNDS
jgi:hypothetical protein